MTSRRALRRLKAMAVTGDRAGVVAWVDERLQPRKPRARRARRTIEAKVALYLACGAAAGRLGTVLDFLEATVAPPPLPSEPATQCLDPDAIRFVCPRLHVEMAVRECLETRGSVWASGGRKGAPKRHECKGCNTGEAFAWACPGIQLRPPQDPPAVLPASQRMAKRAMALVVLGAQDMDPMREAAMATPDDKGEWR